MADKFCVEDFEVGWVAATESPEFAAADVEDLAGAIELTCEVNGALTCAGLGIGEAGVYRGAGLFALHAVETIDAGKVIPRGFAFLGGLA
jgi:hypothetical protein